MSWNYRIYKEDLGNNEFSYTIREAYYNEDGNIWSCSKDPVVPYSESPEGLVKVLENMLKDIKKSLTNPITKDTKFSNPDWMKNDTEELVVLSTKKNIKEAFQECLNK